MMAEIPSPSGNIFLDVCLSLLLLMQLRNEWQKGKEKKSRQNGGAPVTASMFSDFKKEITVQLNAFRDERQKDFLAFRLQIDNGLQDATIPPWASETTLLLVDDNHDDRELFGRLMRGICRLFMAADLSYAIKLIEERHPGCVILDLNLVEIRGVDTLIELREHYTGPVVVLTGDESPMTLRAALENGANEYIVKGRQDKSATQILDHVKMAIAKHREPKP